MERSCEYLLSCPFLKRKGKDAWPVCVCALVCSAVQDMLVGSSPEAAVFNTPAQSRTQFSLWSIMAAPLLIGSNMLNMTAFDLETYSNTEVIQVDQDPLGVQGKVIWENCLMKASLEDIVATRGAPLAEVPSCQQIWARPLQSGAWAAAFVNYDGHNAANVTCDVACFAAMGMDSASIRDLWSHVNMGTFTAPFTVAVPADGSSWMFKFTPLSA
eukprot:m.130525 g.130525  ORF g.130525 m.130525 type:complete len:214 (+) comp52349_c0_seq2:672-1313(+)